MQTQPSAGYAARRMFWRVVWVISGVALLGCSIAVVVWMTNKTLSAHTGFAALDGIVTGISGGFIIAAIGLGLLGAGIGGISRLEPVPDESATAPYRQTTGAARARRLRFKHVCNRIACIILGIALIAMGPQLLMEGITGVETNDPGGRPREVGPIGAGFVMTLVGLAVFLYGTFGMRRAMSESGKPVRAASSPPAKAVEAEQERPVQVRAARPQPAASTSGQWISVVVGLGFCAVGILFIGGSLWIQATVGGELHGIVVGIVMGAFSLFLGAVAFFSARKKGQRPAQSPAPPTATTPHAEYDFQN